MFVGLDWPKMKDLETMHGNGIRRQRMYYANYQGELQTMRSNELSALRTKTTEHTIFQTIACQPLHW
jgi:hypothetical protein